MHSSIALPIAVGGAMAVCAYQLEKVEEEKIISALKAWTVGVGAMRTMTVQSHPGICLGLTVASTAYQNKNHITAWMRGKTELKSSKLFWDLAWGMGVMTLGCRLGESVGGVVRMGAGAINFAKATA